MPREQRQTIVQKTHTFYHQCQRLLHAYYVPGRDFAVDETMVRFQGRSSWITVIKGKPEPIGYKLYAVASEGYLLGFRIYRRKGGTTLLRTSCTTRSWTSSYHGKDTTASSTWTTCTLPQPSAMLCSALASDPVVPVVLIALTFLLTSPPSRPRWPRVRPRHGRAASWAVSCGMTPSPSSSYPLTCGLIKSPPSTPPPSAPPPSVLPSLWTTT